MVLLKHLLFLLVGRCFATVQMEECAAAFPCVCSQPPACFTNSEHKTCSKAVIACDNRSLDSIPRCHKTEKYFDMIEYSHNNIMRVEAYAFSNYTTSLTLDLYLNDNPITYIDDLAFMGLEDIIVTLHLNNTHLLALPEALVKLNNLNELTINNLNSMGSVVTRSIGKSLEILDIDMGSMSQWPSEMNQLHHLKRLTIRECPTLPVTAFRGLDSLLFMEFFSAVLANSPDALCSVPTLREISLNDVKISHNLVPKCSAGLTELKVFRAFRVDHIRFNTIMNAYPSVSDLYVIACKIAWTVENTVYTDNNITGLNLGNNNLSAIPGMIKKMTKLKGLYLGANNIKIIGVQDFKDMSRLTFIGLNTNPISSIAEYAFRDCTSTIGLDLSRTSLLTIPRAILHLSNLRNLWLYETNVKCDCNLLWLTHWDRLAYVRIWGNCFPSNETISDFIKFKLATCSHSPIG